MKTINAKNQEDATTQAAVLLWSKITATLRMRTTCALGIVGGRAIPGLLEQLVTIATPTKGEIRILWLDERVHSDKNFVAALPALERLVAKGVHISWYPIVSTDARVAECEAAEALTQLDEKRFDVIVLSAGEDGHIASLFPRNAALLSRKQSYVLVRDAPKPPPLRVSVSPALIRSAGSALLIFAGEKKAAYVHFCDEKVSVKNCPAKLALAVKDLTVVVALD